MFTNLLLHYFSQTVLTNKRKKHLKKIKDKGKKGNKEKKGSDLSKCLESIAIAQGSAQRRFEEERNT